MPFAGLLKFITRDMRMAHIYQPVMLLALLRQQGRMSARGIARALLEHDESQIEYYTAITNNMVGKVLRNRAIVDKDGPDYVLKDFASLAPDEVDQLVAACRSKLAEFKEARGATIWAHGACRRATSAARSSSKS
jgi:ATP adenylyltransferase